MNTKYLTVYGIKCKNCGDIIFSRARHDFRECSCFENSEYNKGCAIDGGFDYCKISGSNYLGVFISLKNVSETDLFNDYNSGIDKYGLIQIKYPTWIDSIKTQKEYNKPEKTNIISYIKRLFKNGK
jgi:hypothetical protein